jgi:hypothetical protein
VSYSEVELFLESAGYTAATSFGTSFVEGRIEAAQAWMERQTNRKFETVEETRVFDGTGTQRLVIDDLQAGTTAVAVSLNSAELPTTAYAFYPANEWPKTAVVRCSTEYAPTWLRGQQNVSIAGTWGYLASGTACLDLNEACLMLVSLMLLAGKLGGLSGSAISSMLRVYQTGSFRREYGMTPGGQSILSQATGWAQFIRETVRAHKRAYVG